MTKVLIAEDERPIARLLEMNLTRAGYVCTLAPDGLTAADLIEKNDYDLALLDIMLPGLDGYALLDYLRPQGVPVIFLTAKAAAHDPESLPKEAALRAFADQAGLTSLGDWTWREDLTYPRAIYSLNGQALVAAASGAYTVNDYFTYSGATSDRWYVSIELSLCAEANLPLRMQDDTTNLEKEANPNA